MIGKYEITEKKVKPFIGDEGEEIDYAWYKALREADGVSIKFGSLDTSHDVGDKHLELNIEKTERLDKKGNTTFIYKEIIG